VVDGERATGAPNTIYDLASVLFQSLEGGASYDIYIEDAEREEDEELTEFFRRVREEDRDRVAEAHLLLAERTSNAARAEEGVAGVSAEDLTSPAEDATSPRPEPSLDFPGTEPVREDDSTARTGEVPPPPEEVPPERAGEISTAEEVPPPRTEELLGGNKYHPELRLRPLWGTCKGNRLLKPCRGRKSHSGSKRGRSNRSGMIKSW
jgi:hypothetical protein